MLSKVDLFPYKAKWSCFFGYFLDCRKQLKKLSICVVIFQSMWVCFVSWDGEWKNKTTIFFFLLKIWAQPRSLALSKSTFFADHVWPFFLSLSLARIKLSLLRKKTKIVIFRIKTKKYSLISFWSLENCEKLMWLH